MMWFDNMGSAVRSALHRKETLSQLAKLFGVVLLLSAQIAVAQEKLGELLDAGAKVLSPDDFKQELVQRVLVGPTPSGTGIEIVYTSKGLVQGSASGLTQGMGGLLTPINGE